MSATGHATRSRDESYLSYVSPLLLHRLEMGKPVVVPESERIRGAVALIDVEHFSSFAERMASRGNEGVELISTHINDTFALVVEAVERYGGIAHGFPGDSVIALWTDQQRSFEEAALLATRCVLELLDRRRDSELPLKAGLSTGDMNVSHVGGFGGHVQLLLSGAPLEGMGRAEEHASRGRLIVTEDAWCLLAPHAIAAVEADGFLEVKSLRAAAAPAAPRPLFFLTKPVSVETARAYLPAALLRQLDAGQADWLGEFREVSTVFIQIRTADDAGPGALDRIQDAFREIQRALYRHGGDVTRFAHDDKGLTVLAIFGLPPASSEAAAARAVAAAVQIDEQAPRHRFRCSVGIATGRVFCGTLGAPGRREFSVVGSTPNLAARLMQSAPSGVLCDAATTRAVSAAGRFEPAGRLTPKGFPGPVEVFRPCTDGATPASPSRSPSAFVVGRDEETGRLQAWIEDLHAELAQHRGEAYPRSTSAGGRSRERRCCLAVVQGEAGVGKTTLVRQALTHAAQEGLEVVRISCEAVQTSSTYASWSKVLRRLLQLYLVSSDEQKTTRVLRALADGGIGDEMAPLLGPILEISIEDNETTREMTGTARSDNLLAMLSRLVAHLAIRRRDSAAGLLLVLEDVHWLDPASWELLSVVTRTLDTSVLGVLATMRSETMPSSGDWHDVVNARGVETITLSPLSRTDTRELVRHLLRADDVNPQLLQLTFERTRGNPFFCEQLVSELADSGLAEVEGGVATLRLRNPEQAESLVPGSVAAVVTSRLDRLPAPAQLTLKTASVIGARFHLDVLRAIHPMHPDDEDLRSHLASASALGLLEDSDPDEAVRCFQHAITCDVAYGLLLVSQRRQLHREVAEYLERNGESAAAQAVLFYHWRRSGDEQRALEHVDRAGDEAMRNGNFHAVTELYGYALQTLASHPDGAERKGGRLPPREALWSGHLGQAQVAIGLHEAARSNLELSLETLGERPHETRLSLALGIASQALLQMGHRIAPRRFVGMRAREAERLALAANTYEQLGFVYYAAGELLPGLYATFRILNLAELAGEPGLMARSYGVMSLTASVVGRHRIASLYDRLAVELARESDDALVTAYVGWVTGLRAAGEARWDLVRMRVESAQRLAEQAGDRRLGMMCLTVMEWPLYVNGEFERATAVAEQQLAMARESNNRLWEAWGLNGLSEPAVMMGDHETTIRCCQRSLAVLSQESDHSEEIRALGLMAYSLLRQSRGEEAYETARRALDRIESSQITSYIMCEGVAAAGEVMLELSEAARARTGTVPSTLQRDVRRAETAHARFTKIFAIGRPRLHTARARIAALAGSRPTAMAEFEKALRSAEALGMPHAKGMALLAAARCPLLEPETRRRRAEEAVSVLRAGEALKEARELVSKQRR